MPKEPVYTAICYMEQRFRSPGKGVFANALTPLL